MVIYSYDWNSLKNGSKNILIPEHSHQIIDYCEELFSLYEHVDKVGIEYMNNNQILRQIYDLCYKIINEYLSIIQEFMKTDEKIIKDVRNDIYRTLSMFYRGDGTYIDWASFSVGDTQAKVYMCFAAVMSFAETRIYNPFIETYNDVTEKKRFMQLFSYNSTQRAGFFPHLEKPKLEALEPEEEKGKEEKKKGRKTKEEEE